MAKGEGYIKISRQLEEWEHFDNLPLTGFWIHLLLRASWKNTRRLQAGELFLTYDGIAEECGISRSTVRRYLNTLRETGEIETFRDGHKTRARIVNWNKYQKVYFEPIHEPIDEPVIEPIHEPIDEPVNRAPYPYINDKKNKEQRIKNKEVVIGESAAPPTPDQVMEYAKSIGYEIDAEYFCDYYAECGWIKKNGQPITDWKATIRNWKRKEKPKNEINGGYSEQSSDDDEPEEYPDWF